MQKMRLVLLVGFSAVLAACGSSNNDTTTDFQGNYDYSVFKLTANTCNSDVAQTIDRGRETVTESDGKVSINSFGTIFNGTVDGDNMGFTASVTQEKDGIPVVSKYAFRRIVIGRDYAVNFTITTGACAVQYSGTALRDVPAQAEVKQ